MKTPYNEIEVVDEGSFRLLHSGKGWAKEQGAVVIGDGSFHVYDYSWLAMYSLSFVSHPESVLVIGLGAGVIPRTMNLFYPDTHIDILEIDPHMLEVAREFFDHQETRYVRTHIGNAFTTIDEMCTQYDIIIADASIGNYTPFELMALEFIKKTDAKMKDRSVMAMNVCRTHPAFNSQIRTVLEVFEEPLYELGGTRNPHALMTYVTKGGIRPQINFDLPESIYPRLLPSPMEVSDEIREAEIFSLSSFRTV